MKKISVSRRTFDILTKLYRIGGFVLVVTALTVFSIMRNKLVQFVIMFMSYFMTKGRYETQWHTKGLKQCFIASLVIFAVAVELVPGATYSIVLCGVFGSILSYFSYAVGDYCKLNKENRELKAKYEQLQDKVDELTKFKLNGCTPEQLEERCRQLGFKPKIVEFCLRAFTDKFGYYTDAELAEYYCMEIQSVKNKKYLYRHKLEK